MNDWGVMVSWHLAEHTWHTLELQPSFGLSAADSTAGAEHCLSPLTNGRL